MVQITKVRFLTALERRGVVRVSPECNIVRTSQILSSIEGTALANQKLRMISRATVPGKAGCRSGREVPR